MTKYELIDQVAKRANTSKVSARRVVDALSEVILEGILSGDRRSIPGIGSFCQQRSATGSSKVSLRFTPVEAVRDALKRLGVAILGVLLFGGVGMAAGLGVDANRNGLWDDFDQAVQQGSPHLAAVAEDLARSLQEFTMSPPGNRSLAAQSMQRIQNNMLCLMAVAGVEGGEFPRVLKGLVDRNPERARRFQKNEETIRGEKIPFNPDPRDWRQYCPDGLALPRRQPARVDG